MKSSFIIILFFGMILRLFSQDTNQQSWIFLNNNIKLSDKVTIGLQLWDRHWYGEDYQRDMFFVNPVFRYKTGIKTKILAGVFNIFDIKNNAEGIPLDKTEDHFEFRPWQGFQVDHITKRKIKITTLSRLEERFIFKEKYNFDLRFRERVTIQYLLTQIFFAKGFSEIIMNIDDDTGLLFNPYELRNHIGMGIKMNSNITMELGYEFYYERENYGAGIDDGYDLGFDTNMYTLTLNFNHVIKKKQ